MKEKKLNPNWITGFVDGEGCFHVKICQSKYPKIKWQIQPCFQIQLHKKDKDLLVQIKSFFGEIGTIRVYKECAHYIVSSWIHNIKVIIPHFDKYPLLSQKYSDFILFKNIVELMSKGEHLTVEGLTKIVSLRASTNCQKN